MSRRHPPPPTGELTSTFLRSLARALSDAGLSGPHVVHLTADSSGGEVRALPLAELTPPVEHPLQALVGFTAPSTWEAIGVVAPGTAHQLDEAGAPTHSFPVGLTLLVARNGAQGVALRSGRSDTAQLSTAPSEGLLSDALHRCLSLATAPPTQAPSFWLTCTWLDRLCPSQGVSQAPGSTVRSAAEALARHPLATTSGPAATAASLRARAARVDEAGWEAVWRAVTHTGASPSAVSAAARFVPPRLARWADPGSLARLLEAELPPATFLLDAARALLPSAAQRAVIPLAAEHLDRRRRARCIGPRDVYRC